MKRFFIPFVTILFIMVGGACTQKKTYKIGISQCSSDDWRAKMNEEVLLEGMLHDDVEVQILSADGDSRKQIADLEYFANNNFDVIVVAPNEGEALTPEIEKIHKEGIPVIIFDRDILSDAYTQRIGVDNIKLGEMAGTYALHLMGDTLKAIEIAGLPGSSPAQSRNKGFMSAITKENGEIVGSAHADWLMEKAEIVAESLIVAHPEANLIFAHNDRMALGARKAMDNRCITGLKIIGIDAAPKIGMKAVNDGLIDATFIYPTQGHTILREAIKVAKGMPFDREIMLPTASAVDASNVDILSLQNAIIVEDSQRVVSLKEQLDEFVNLHQAQTALVYAVIAILILLFGVLFLVLRTFWIHKRHQNVLMLKNKLLEEERDKQKELNEKLEEATQSKLVFFTNVSHDLRTPLTLIAEPVSQLSTATNLDSSQHNLIKIADKNVKILQRLINQILDFRKYENNKLPLTLMEIDFSASIKEWIDSFHSVARKRDIKLVLDAPKEDIKLALDPEKVERVFFNLISNAMKYSPDNSTITVTYYLEEGDKLILKVADNGEGISQEDIANIFDRFFQVDRIRPRGSGIGLSLAKAFVEMHGGSITVESELKKGSVFTVILPVRHVAEKTSEVTKFITHENVESELGSVEIDTKFEDDKPLLLVIDDNKDIREMVTELMKENYNILTAPNGKEGLKKAEKYVPDLVICDVMMPGIDGMEVCSRLKSETVTSHIPVLMLTACSLDEQRAQGFDSGADGYLSKPFSAQVLKSQAAALIANRKRIKNIFGSISLLSKEVNTKTEKSNPENSYDVDNDFYIRFTTLFEEKISDPDLNVEMLASDLGFERTQFYRKIKAITNYSPVELMRNLRLKKARTLLKTSDKTISEISYEVGFSTPAYFSKCYREQFGETPSETRSK